MHDNREGRARTERQGSGWKACAYLYLLEGVMMVQRRREMAESGGSSEAQRPRWCGLGGKPGCSAARHCTNQSHANNRCVVFTRAGCQKTTMAIWRQSLAFRAFSGRKMGKNNFFSAPADKGSQLQRLGEKVPNKQIRGTPRRLSEQLVPPWGWREGEEEGRVPAKKKNSCWLH